MSTWIIGKKFNETLLHDKKGILYGSNEIRTHNQLVSLQTNWFWVRISLLSLNFIYDACFEQEVP